MTYSLFVYIGMCWGLWCSVNPTGTFNTLEECDTERAKITQLMLKQTDDNIVLFVCRPNNDDDVPQIEERSK